MGQRITLDISNASLRRARQAAERSGRAIEDVLADWVDDYADNIPVELLSNDEVLWLCHQHLDMHQAHELRRLLNKQQQHTLSETDSARLDTLLQNYRRVLIRKSRALQVASARGLPVPTEDNDF